MSNTSSADLATTLKNSVLIVVCLLPLIVPFGLTRNVNAQAAAVSLTGLLAWWQVYLQRRIFVQSLPRKIVILIVMYGLLCLLSVLLNRTLANLFGGPLMRLGSVELLSCVGIALCLLAIPATRLVAWLYGSMVVLAAISLPYSLLETHQLVRIGGLLHQPDFLAVLVSIGLLLGWQLWQHLPQYRQLLIIAQLLLAATLLLTQTRAVIGLSVVISLLYIWRQKLPSGRKLILSGLVVVLVVVGLLGIRAMAPDRLTNARYASQSISYRLSLQHYALRAAEHRPLFGYGAGNIKTALACPTLHNAALQQTCHSGYYFDSSHNVFLDRFLELGWLGGLAFISFVVLSLWKGLAAPISADSIFAYGALLIAAYYFTNVSNLEIEMLLWITLLRPFGKANHA